MRHPSEYTTTPFHGLQIMVVDAGTVIKDERSGQEATITDSSYTIKGRLMYCTQPVFDKLKRHVQ